MQQYIREKRLLKMQIHGDVLHACRGMREKKERDKNNLDAWGNQRILYTGIVYSTVKVFQMNISVTMLQI